METQSNNFVMQLSMQPLYLASYSTLIEKYLQRQQLLFEQKYKPNEAPQILKNYDIDMYTLRVTSEQPQEDEEITDESLLRRIEQYNRIAKPSRARDKDKSRRHRRNGDDGKPKRKVRTTITPAKLEEMNRIFRDYLENQERNRDFKDEDALNSAQSDRQAEYGSLKLIGERLGLGYSTILHKFREYRATRKVKGGALIASINQKRKYKKSREIEELIQRSLNESTFYTAVELSKYIQDKYGKVLSRSIISRHLGEMGYSYKNVKTNRPANKNTNQIKEIRKIFAVALAMERDRHLVQIYYLDQLTLCYDQASKGLHSSQPEDDSLFELHLTVLASHQGILKYQLGPQPMEETQFTEFFKEIDQIWTKIEAKAPKILLMDMDNPNHVNKSMIQSRRRLKQHNVRIFYQPPFSSQLNILDWLFLDLRKQLSAEICESADAFRQNVEKVMQGYFGGNGSSMRGFEREAQMYIKRSMIMQNF